MSVDSSYMRVEPGSSRNHLRVAPVDSRHKIPSTASICERLALGYHTGDIRDKITLSWRNLNVYVKAKSPGNRRPDYVQEEPIQILKKVSGIVKPGTIVAILGHSGAGKTTLLNVLNQRNTTALDINGDIRVNGEKLGRGITALSAYVQQDDLFIGILKVKEHLWFQAMLKMGIDISNKMKQKRVEEVLDELGLRKVANSRIGCPGTHKAISGGERKRLAFASEVLTNPALLFCDEPTSCLDSFTAENVIETLKGLAEKGKTVMLTIHQPSCAVYNMFDQVLYMAEGRVVWMGPAEKMDVFFKRIVGACPYNYNPAEYYIRLLAIRPGNEAACRERVRGICDAFAASDQYGEIRKEIKNRRNNNIPNDELVENIMDISRYKSTRLQQFMVVMWRSWITVLREPLLLRLGLGQTLVLSLILGLIFIKQEHNQAGVMNINGVLFIMQAQTSIMNLVAVINTFPLELPVFIREHRSGMYRCDIYFISKILAEWPCVFLKPVLFTSLIYWMIGLNPSLYAFSVCVGTLVLVALTASAYGYMVSIGAGNPKLAVSAAPFVMLPMFLFSGFFINSESIPIGFLWMKYVSWFHYADEILIVNQWQNITQITCEYEGEIAAQRCFTDGQAVIDHLGFHNDLVLGDTLATVGLLVIFRTVGYLLLLFRARRK